MMQFKQILQESLRRYKLKYIGTRHDYEIHDQNPYVISFDERYNVDGNGLSILGVNLNYYDGDLKKIIDDINDNDNKNGFHNFEIKTKLKKIMNRGKDISDWEIEEKKRRYNTFIDQFPYMSKFIRRYKIQGHNGSGIIKQTRKIINN